MNTISNAAGPLETTQVLIVGGGPVGLFAALSAARRGLEVTLVEQNFRGHARGHATTLHPSSLRLMAELGLSRQLLAEGHALDSVQLYVDGNPALNLALPQPALSLGQAALEEILLNALRLERVRILAPCEVSSLEQGPEFVRMSVARRELLTLGSTANCNESQPVDTSVVEARFVIGADGYESFVRSALGVDNLHAGPTETFALFEGPGFGAGSSLELALDADFVSAIFPLVERRTRWGFQLGSELSREPDLEFLSSLLAQRAPWLTGKPERVDWSIVTHFERRYARRFGSRRTWLAGDAAHVTSPFGGQSMNGGLLEVHGLVERMAACIFEQKSLATLEQWAAEREREWHRLLGVQAQIEARPGTPTWLRDGAPRLLPALPVSDRDLHQLLEEMGLFIRR